MAEILPDGTYQNYFRQCKICGKTIETNIQGDELGKHTCGPIREKDPVHEKLLEQGMVITDPSTADWDAIFKMKETRRDIPKTVHWKEEDLKDFLGNPIKVGDRAVRVHSYSNSKDFKKVTIKKINLFNRWTPIGFITDGNEKIGWTYPERLITQEAFKIDL